MHTRLNVLPFYVVRVYHMVFKAVIDKGDFTQLYGKKTVLLIV